jgi:hypothetical protein
MLSSRVIIDSGRFTKKEHGVKEAVSMISYEAMEMTDYGYIS